MCFGKVKRLASKDESSESDDESSESDEEGSESDEDEETTPIENKNCKVDKFWSMSPLLKTPILDIKKKVGAAIRTFVSHIRPLIIIDGAHLKVAMDGNNQILPLAYGVGKSETFRSWDWFLRKLKECIIGKQDNLTIISDGVVSIASAINNVFPNVFHGHCCRHLLMNLREKCPRFISKEELFWKACKAYRISDFEEHFSTLRNWLPSVANKLDMIGLEKWARVHFPVEGSIATGCFGDMKTFIKNGKVKKVVVVIKSCTPNMLGDLTITLKDLSGIISGTIHYKVLNAEVYGKAISVGAVLILRNVLVFSPKSSSLYLNITLKNILKVFHKDTSAVNSGYGASTSRESYWAEEI
nr:hypothetical protein [Tanacetum cinerariifolium]